MHPQIFVNLPIADMATSKAFFSALGYGFNPDFTSDQGAALVSLVAKARAAGGRVPRPPQDHGFMYAHGFEDLDGHVWELVHMNGMPPQE